jgi:hypothetical protein
MGRSALCIDVAKKDQKAWEKFLSGGVQPVRALLPLLCRAGKRDGTANTNDAGRPMFSAR